MFWLTDIQIPCSYEFLSTFACMKANLTFVPPSLSLSVSLPDSYTPCPVFLMCNYRIVLLSTWCLFFCLIVSVLVGSVLEVIILLGLFVLASFMIDFMVMFVIVHSLLLACRKFIRQLSLISANFVYFHSLSLSRIYIEVCICWLLFGTVVWLLLHVFARHCSLFFGSFVTH